MTGTPDSMTGFMRPITSAEIFRGPILYQSDDGICTRAMRRFSIDTVSSPSRHSNVHSINYRGPFDQTSLELMHHWCTYADIMLSPPRAGLEEWFRDSAARCALSENFCLDAMLALAALHRSSQGTDESSKYLCLGQEYHQRAIAGFREALSCSQPRYFPTLRLFTTFTGWTVVALGHERIPRKILDPLATFLAACRAWRGVYVFEIDMICPLEQGSALCRASKASTLPLLDFRAIIVKLEELVADRWSKNSRRAQIYNQAIERLQLRCDKFLLTGIVKNLFFWGLEIENDFIVLLEMHDDTSLVITLCYCALLQYNCVWAAEGLAIRMAEQIWLLVDHEDEALKKLCERMFARLLRVDGVNTND